MNMTPFDTGKVLKLMLLIALNSFVKGENCDTNGVLLYEDIGCKPVKSEGENCPKSFNCVFSRPKNGCTFKGKNYASAEDIPSDLTYAGCSIGCRCEDFNFIRCAVLDCPEYLGAFRDPGCHREYELGKCCAIGQRCNVTAEDKKCQVDGQTYEIGQRFYPKNTCFSCVCHENFTGEYDEETCVRQNCVAQIRFAEEIVKKCAPAYFNYHSEQALCCPDDFVCPDPGESITVINREANHESSLECQYGDQKLKLGEGFSRKINKYGKDRNLKCECITPPLVTCREV